MATASTKPTNDTSPVPGLPPSEHNRIHTITRAIDANLGLGAPLLQQLGSYNPTKLLDPKSNRDPTCQKIIRLTVFLIKNMSDPESQPHINLISYYWLTLLQNLVNNDQIDGKDGIIAELEEKKANLTPMPIDGFNLIIQPQTSKTFTPTETLQRLAGLCAKEPSPSNLYGFWKELRPTFLSCFSFHIETEMEALQILNTHYGTWTFTKFYEILCFRRDIFLCTPPHAAKHAAAAEHLWRCFKNLIDNLSEDSLDAFNVAWWYFAICEIDHPPLLPAACALTADLKIDLSHIHISKNTQALQQELRYLSFEMDGFRSKNFKYSDDPKKNLDAHVAVVTHFFELCLVHIKSLYPNITLIETSAFKNLVVGYFVYYGIYQNIQENSLIKPILSVPPTYLKLLAAKLENHLLLLQTLPPEHLEEVFTLSILEYLHTLLELLCLVPDSAKEVLIAENQSHVNQALGTIYEELKQTTNFKDDGDLSNILRIIFGMSSISTTDPMIAQFATSFALDITPFLQGSGPYAKIDPAILATARQLAGSIASKDRSEIKRDDLRQLALLWIEGTRSGIFIHLGSITTNEQQRIMRRLNLQTRMCLPAIENNLTSALVEACPYLTFLFSTNGHYLIPADLPFLGLIEQALTYLFENRPIVANHPHVAGKLKTFPFNFPKAIQANLNVFVPLLTKFFHLLEELKAQKLTAQNEHLIYAYLGTINELWLTSIIQDIERIPQKQRSWTAHAQTNKLPGKIDLEELNQVKINTIKILNKRLSELREHCKTHVFSETLSATNAFEKWTLLLAFAKRAHEEISRPLLKTLCPLLGEFCISREGELRLASFFPIIQEKLNHCQNFDFRFLEAAFEKRFEPHEHQARFLCDAFLNLIAFIADGNSDLGTAPAIFLDAWRRFVLLQNGLELPQILKTELPIQTKPNFSFFEHWVSLCPKNKHLATSFTPQNLLDAYFSRDPASNGLIIAADVLFISGPSHKEALCALQNAWIKLQLKVWISLCPQSNHFAAETFTAENLFNAYAQPSNPTLTRAINTLFKTGPDKEALDALETEWLKIAPAWIKGQLEYKLSKRKTTHYAAATLTAENLFNAYSSSYSPALTQAINSLLIANSSDKAALLTLQTEWFKVASIWVKEQLEHRLPNCPKSDHYAATTFTAENLLSAYSSSYSPALNAAINSLLKANPSDTAALLNLQTTWLKIAPAWIKQQAVNPKFQGRPGDKSRLALQAEWLHIAPAWIKELFKNWISQCPEQQLHAYTDFTPESLFEAYTTIHPELPRLDNLSSAINTLFKQGPTNKTLNTLVLEWFNLAPSRMTQSYKDCKNNTQLVKDLKKINKKLTPEDTTAFLRLCIAKKLKTARQRLQTKIN